MRIETSDFRSRGAMPWSLVESGLWMRAGIAGAAVAVVSPALVVTGEWSPLSGVIALVAGALLTVFAYRRTRKLLGADVVIPDDAVPAARAATLKPAHDSRVRTANVHAA